MIRASFPSSYEERVNRSIDEQEGLMSKNVNYYNNHAQEFHDRTVRTDLTDIYNAFLKHLSKDAHILDAGCGVGRDSNHFLNHGYKVTAFGASHEMAKMASSKIGQEVPVLTFQEMRFDSIFDGVWAQLSLIHVPYEETRSVYEKIHRALKENGIFLDLINMGMSPCLRGAEIFGI